MRCVKDNDQRASAVIQCIRGAHNLGLYGRARPAETSFRTTVPGGSMEGWGRRFDPVGTFVRVSIKLPLSRLVLLLNLEPECPTLQLFRR